MHRRLEDRFDAVTELANPLRRTAIVDRYATLYHSAHEVLASKLEDVEGLDFEGRRRAWNEAGLPTPRVPDRRAFPNPADRSEALGSYYVIEGSALGGAIILRELRGRGIAEEGLSFLDPYRHARGERWRAMMKVLEREGSRSSAHLEGMCRGAVRGFDYADAILCVAP